MVHCCEQVHRTHYEIFGYHYHPIFSNWWCDDWMSLVYAYDKLDLAHRVGKGKALVRHFIGAVQPYLPSPISLLQSNVSTLSAAQLIAMLATGNEQAQERAATKRKRERLAIPLTTRIKKSFGVQWSKGGEPSWTGCILLVSTIHRPALDYL